MQLKTLSIVCLLILCSCRLSAVSPDIRLPEWNKTEVGISDWYPDQGLLMLRVSLEAKNVSIHEVTCQLHQNFDQAQTGSIRNKAVVKAGDKAHFIFRLNVKSGLNDWIECDLRARPNQKELRALVAQIEGKPLSKEIMQNEINSITKQIQLGKSIPIFIAKDIALSTTAEMAFRPELEVKGKKFYVWFPPDNLGAGITPETFKALRNSVRAGNFHSAIAACDLLIRRLEKNEQSISISKSKGEKFMIPAKVAQEMVKANKAIFEALKNADSSELIQFAKSMKPSYTRAFVYFNLAQILSISKRNTEALDWINNAMLEVPAWPEARRVKKLLEK